MNKEVIEKIIKCNSIDEVLKLAKDNGKDITKEKAEMLFNKVHNKVEGELSDNEINNVAGGISSCDATPDRNAYSNVIVWDIKNVKYIFEIGQEAEYFVDSKTAKTKTVKIENRKAVYLDHQGYCDRYKIKGDSIYRNRSHFKKS